MKPYEIRQLRGSSRTIDSIAVVSGVSAKINVDGELERVFAVSANVEALTMLGADPPALGRLFASVPAWRAARVDPTIALRSQ